MTRSELDSKYIDRIRALEEQISRLESSFGAKAPSVVSEMMSNNDLLMYIATGAFFIFVMDNNRKNEQAMSTSHMAFLRFMRSAPSLRVGNTSSYIPPSLKCSFCFGIGR